MFKHEYLDDLSLYVAGALSGEEKQRIESHLGEGCPVCQDELLLLRESLSRLPYDLPQRQLPADLKERTWKRIEQSSPPVWWDVHYRKVLLGVAIAFAVFLISASVFWQQNLQVIKLQKEIGKKEQAIRQQEEQIAWLQDPAVQLAMLTGQNMAEKAKGKMVWNPSVSRGIFYVNYLPSIPEQKSYQLWVIGKGGPVSAGVFEPDPGGSAVVIVSRLPSPAEGPLQFAVTIEPRGGVRQPTGSMVLAGKPL
jgi:hypothetical protein